MPRLAVYNYYKFHASCKLIFFGKLTVAIQFIMVIRYSVEFKRTKIGEDCSPARSSESRPLFPAHFKLDLAKRHFNTQLTQVRWNEISGQTRSTLRNLENVCGSYRYIGQCDVARELCGHEFVEHGQWDVNRINIPFYRCAKLFPVPTLIGESETLQVDAILPQRHYHHP